MTFSKQTQFSQLSSKIGCVTNISLVGGRIAGFHCHTTNKTIQQIKSRINEINEDEYSNSLAKVQVCAMFRAGDIRRNVLLKFIRLCMETTCLCPSEGHKYGGRKPLNKNISHRA